MSDDSDEPARPNRRPRGRLVKPIVWLGQQATQHVGAAAKGVGSLLTGRARGAGTRLPLASLSSGYLPAQNVQPNVLEADERQPETNGPDSSLPNPFEAFAAWTASLQLPWQQKQLGEDRSGCVAGTAVDGTLMLDNSGTFPLVMASPISRPALSHSAAATSSSSQQPLAQPAQQSQQEHLQRQQLLTVGSRMWGNWWDGRGLLRVKIYDFAIYVDGHSAHTQVAGSAGKRSLLPRVLRRKQRRAAKHGTKHHAEAPEAASAAPAAASVDVGSLQQDEAAQRSQAASTSSSASGMTTSTAQTQQPRRRSRRAKASSGAASTALVTPATSLAARLMGSSGSGSGGQQFVPMSLVLRASRDIPLATLANEYQRVLERRLSKVGGNPQDPDLSALVATFAPSQVPRSIRHGSGSVAKGTMMTFERGTDGALTARVGPHVLGKFSSPKLCEALFDLYLGDNPVSKKAKVAAGDTLARLSRSSEELYRPQSGAEKIRCSGPELSACVLELKD